MSIQVEPFPPAPGGMNTAIPAWEIDDTEAQYVQDALMDKPGLLRRRGPVKTVVGMGQPGFPITEMCMTLDPAGNTRFGALNGDTSHGNFDVWSNDGTTTLPLTWPHPLPHDPGSGLATAYRHANARAALLGGTWVGASDRVDANAPLQGMGLWRGGNTANYSTGTMSMTRGSASITGVGTAWLSKASIGQHIFCSTDDGLTLALAGVVRQIVSDTSIVMQQVSPYNATTKAYQMQALRGFAPKVGTGLITCATANATVNGGDTKFKSQGLGTGTWNLYRRSDLTWIGKVLSVATEIQLTLAANSAIALSDEPYIALQGDADFSMETVANTQKVGWLSAVYAERNFYANNGAQFEKTFRLWYSDTDDPELVDMSADGSWIPVDSTGDINEPIRGLGPAYNAMVILKDTETFALYGTSPATFSVKKLWDDGTLGGGSMQLYGGGVIWAGQQGINFYDGVTVNNLTIGKLGEVWKNSVQTFDPARYRMYSMIVHDHYFLHIENLQPTIRVVKGNVATVPTRWTVAINMVTRAVSLNTNLNMRGAVRLPTEANDQVWYAANGAAVADATTNVGNTTAGASAPAEVYVGNEYVTKVTAPSSGYAFQTKIRFDGLGVGAGASTQVQAVLYTDTPGSPATLVATSDTQTVLKGAAAAAYTFTFATPPAITSGASYWLGFFVSGGGSQVARVCYDFSVGAGYQAPASTVMSAWTGGSAWAANIAGYFTLAAVNGHICIADALFNAEGFDEFACDGGTVGPDFFFESKKFNQGDPLLLKRFKQLAIYYLVQGGSIKLDTVTGLNDLGAQNTTDFPASVYTWTTLSNTVKSWTALKNSFNTWTDLVQGVYVPKRIRFLKRNQHFSFRLYQSGPGVVRLRIGPYEIGWKNMRPGRV